MGVPQGGIITGNQVATKSWPSHKIFSRNPAIITIYVKFIYQMNESEQTTTIHPLKGLFKVKANILCH